MMALNQLQIYMSTCDDSIRPAQKKREREREKKKRNTNRNAHTHGRKMKGHEMDAK